MASSVAQMDASGTSYALITKGNKSDDTNNKVVTNSCNMMNGNAAKPIQTDTISQENNVKNSNGNCDADGDFIHVKRKDKNKKKNESVPNKNRNKKNKGKRTANVVKSNGATSETSTENDAENGAENGAEATHFVDAPLPPTSAWTKPGTNG